MVPSWFMIDHLLPSSDSHGLEFYRVFWNRVSLALSLMLLTHFTTQPSQTNHIFCILFSSSSSGFGSRTLLRYAQFFRCICYVWSSLRLLRLDTCIEKNKKEKKRRVDRYRVNVVFQHFASSTGIRSIKAIVKKTDTLSVFQDLLSGTVRPSPIRPTISLLSEASWHAPDHLILTIAPLTCEEPADMLKQAFRRVAEHDR